jgi:hypothetical protein
MTFPARDGARPHLRRRVPTWGGGTQNWRRAKRQVPANLCSSIGEGQQSEPEEQCIVSLRAAIVQEVADATVGDHSCCHRDRRAGGVHPCARTAGRGRPVARAQSDPLANADRPERRAPPARPARQDRQARRATIALPSVRTPRMPRRARPRWRHLQRVGAGNNYRRKCARYERDLNDGKLVRNGPVRRMQR